MTISAELQRMFLSAYESWRASENSEKHRITVFTESSPGAAVTKRVISEDSLADARELAYLEAQRGLDAIVVHAESGRMKEIVLFEFCERNSKMLQRFELDSDVSSPFSFRFIESVLINSFRQSVWEAKPYHSCLYTRRAKKIQVSEFLNFFQTRTNYTIESERQSAVYLNQDTDISFELSLVPYNEAGECCISVAIPTLKSDIFALESAKELESICAEFDIEFHSTEFIANWSERNLFEARRFLKMFGESHQETSFAEMLPTELLKEAKRLNSQGSENILLPPKNWA